MEEWKGLFPLSDSEITFFNATGVAIQDQWKFKVTVRSSGKIRVSDMVDT
jgi:ornithine cyclodeaminase/alanine dehydrogenase-like protein (mu-crystallin family)